MSSFLNRTTYSRRRTRLAVHGGRVSCAKRVQRTCTSCGEETSEGVAGRVYMHLELTVTLLRSSDVSTRVSV